MARKPIAVSSGIATVVLCDDGTLWVAVTNANEPTTIKWLKLPPIPQLGLATPSSDEEG
jgi:hypothetical protein